MKGEGGASGGKSTINRPGPFPSFENLAPPDITDVNIMNRMR